MNIKGVLVIAIHPYVGIVRIRLEGIISACKSRHPLNISFYLTNGYFTALQ